MSAAWPIAPYDVATHYYFIELYNVFGQGSLQKFEYDPNQSCAAIERATVGLLSFRLFLKGHLLEHISFLNRIRDGATYVFMSQEHYTWALWYRARAAAGMIALLPRHQAPQAPVFINLLSSDEGSSVQST